jgi:3-isopropylmalate dehydrogenase
MNQFDIAVIGGDGIGPEVTAEELKVLDAAAEVYGFKLKYHSLPFGSEHYFKTGEIFPDKAFAEVKGMDAILLGAIGDPRAPVGLIEYGIIAKMRFELDLYINLRPIKVFDERLCPLKGKKAEDIDMVFIRENTEDAYVGAHGFTHKDQANEVATQMLVYTRAGVERAIRYAFELARTRNQRKKVTLIDKANAMRSHDLWTRTFAEVGREYPDITQDHAYVDAACMWMIKNPEWFDVAVTTNMFGDILTDLGAVLQGGLGIAASANIHPGKKALFEPIHGSAPKYAGQNTASPVAAIMAGSMLLDYLGLKEAAQAVEGTVVSLLRAGRIKGVASGLHKCTEVGDMVAGELRSAVAGAKH